MGEIVTKTNIGRFNASDLQSLDLADVIDLNLLNAELKEKSIGSDEMLEVSFILKAKKKEIKADKKLGWKPTD